MSLIFMADKVSIIIKNSSDGLDKNVNVFSLSIGYAQYSFYDFNKDGYLVKLINNLKESEDLCYVLTSFFVHSDYPKDYINNILSVSPENICISSVPIKNFFILERGGQEKHLLIFRKDNILNIKKLIENLAGNSGSKCYIIFDKESNKDKLLSLYKNNRNFENEIISIVSEGIKIEFECCGPECEVLIFSRRHSLDGVKDEILNSIDKEKFEVGVL